MAWRKGVTLTADEDRLSAGDGVAAILWPEGRDTRTECGGRRSGECVYYRRMFATNNNVELETAARLRKVRNRQETKAVSTAVSPVSTELFPCARDSLQHASSSGSRQSNRISARSRYPVPLSSTTNLTVHLIK